jgi:hypothetical protein
MTAFQAMIHIPTPVTRFNAYAWPDTVMLRFASSPAAQVNRVAVYVGMTKVAEASPQHHIAKTTVGSTVDTGWGYIDIPIPAEIAADHVGGPLYVTVTGTLGGAPGEWVELYSAGAHFGRPIRQPGFGRCEGSEEYASAVPGYAVEVTSPATASTPAARVDRDAGDGLISGGPGVYSAIVAIPTPDVASGIALCPRAVLLFLTNGSSAAVTGLDLYYGGELAVPNLALTQIAPGVSLAQMRYAPAMKSGLCLRLTIRLDGGADSWIRLSGSIVRFWPAIYGAGPGAVLPLPSLDLPGSPCEPAGQGTRYAWAIHGSTAEVGVVPADWPGQAAPMLSSLSLSGTSLTVGGGQVSGLPVVQRSADGGRIGGSPGNWAAFFAFPVATLSDGGAMKLKSIELHYKTGALGSVRSLRLYDARGLIASGPLETCALSGSVAIPLPSSAGGLPALGPLQTGSAVSVTAQQHSSSGLLVSTPLAASGSISLGVPSNLSCDPAYGCGLCLEVDVALGDGPENWVEFTSVTAVFERSQ